MLDRIKALFSNKKDKEREAKALRMEIDRKADTTAASIEKLNDVLRNSAAYRIAVAAGRESHD